MFKPSARFKLVAIFSLVVALALAAAVFWFVRREDGSRLRVALVGFFSTDAIVFEEAADSLGIQVDVFSRSAFLTPDAPLKDYDAAIIRTMGMKAEDATAEKLASIDKCRVAVFYPGTYDLFKPFVKLPDGTYAYDKLVGDDLDVELDVYWLAQGGVDPVEYIKRYAQRLPLLHLKDRNPVTNTFTELGTGDIPLAKCVEALEGSKCEWLIYEQDICNYPGIESARISYNNLKKILGY